MKAMILAAGRGERLRPLTDNTPKPLLEIGGCSLIGAHLARLARAGIHDVVINVCYRADQIKQALGDGSRWGVSIVYSDERPRALDTGGGVRAALPWLGEAPFILVSADVWTDFDVTELRTDAHAEGMELVLVSNPNHHRHGDYGLEGRRLVDRGPRLTYAGIGRFAPALFKDRVEPRFDLATVIDEAIKCRIAFGRRFAGAWLDVGRPEDLTRARRGAVRIMNRL